MLPISSYCGLPICLSGISHPLPLCQEMDDHERREIIIKKKFQEHQELVEMMRAQNREASGNGGESHAGGVFNVNGSVVGHEFSCIFLPSTAKAA